MSVRLNSSIGGSVTISPANTSSNTTATLPARNGTVILDNGAGKIQYSDLPAGTVIQVVNTTLYTPTSVALSGQSNFVNIPSYSVNITPRFASSRIYVSARWFGELSPQSANWDTTFGLKRNGTVIGQNPSAGGFNGISMAALGYYADDGNSTPEMMYLDYWDSPNTTSTLTYQLYAVTFNSATLFTNRTVATGGSNYEYGNSTITVWEISQ